MYGTKSHTKAEKYAKILNWDVFQILKLWKISIPRVTFATPNFSTGIYPAICKTTHPQTYMPTRLYTYTPTIGAALQKISFFRHLWLLAIILHAQPPLLLLPQPPKERSVHLTAQFDLTFSEIYTIQQQKLTRTVLQLCARTPVKISLSQFKAWTHSVNASSNIGQAEGL